MVEDRSVGDTSDEKEEGCVLSCALAIEKSTVKWCKARAGELTQ